MPIKRKAIFPWKDFAMQFSCFDGKRKIKVIHPNPKYYATHTFVMDRSRVDLLGNTRWQPMSKKWAYIYTLRNNKKVRLADLIMQTPKGKCVYYLDGNPRNLCKKNLRLIDHSELMHTHRLKPNATGYRGVYKAGRKYKAEIKYERKTRYLGTFPNKVLAAHAYNRAARKYFGKFATLNVV